MITMNTLENMRFGEERALYASRGLTLQNCRFEGAEDGESALKESAEILARDCFFDLRYPLWHVRGVRLERCEMTQNCRAALWYDKDVTISGCIMNGIKAVRECADVHVADTHISSPEFGWKSRGIVLENSSLDSEYAFFGSRGIRARGLRFEGKYSFQYTHDVQIEKSELHTKDAFWHAKNVTVTDSEVDGEYLGWYSEGLTLIRCHIRGTQPLCYCKKLRLIDCTMENCDLAFEYSDVHADVHGGIVSVKNPHRGRVIADEIGEIITTPDSVYPVHAKIAQMGTRVG